MKTPPYDPLRGFTLGGTAAHVNIGWLLTPHEFARDCLTMTKRPQYNTWALATQLPDDIVRMLQSPLVPSNATLDVFESENDVLYPVVTLQAAGLQVRFLLSLASRATQNWFRAVTSDGLINISLEIPETCQVAIAGMPCQIRAGIDVDALLRKCVVVDRKSFLLGTAQAASHFVKLDALPSLIKGFETQNLRLVLVIEAGSESEDLASETTERVLN